MTHVEHALLQVVDEAAGRADQHIHAVGELLALFFIINAAEHDRVTETRMFSEDFRIVEDLHGQLARGRNDDGADRRR